MKRTMPTLFDPATDLAFLIAAIAITVSPGPDNLFIISQGMAHGRRPALFAALGMSSGLVVHIAAVAVGLAAVLAASPLLFRFIQIAGTAYLLWVAWGLWQSGGQPLAQASASRSPDLALWRRGFLMNVLNPKVAVFFLAFLPQFLGPDPESATVRVLWLGLLFWVQVIVIFGAIAWFSGGLGRWLANRDRARRWILRAAAIVLIVVGVGFGLS